MIRQECHIIPSSGRKQLGGGLGGAAPFHSELVKCGASRELEMILLQFHYLSVKW